MALKTKCILIDIEGTIAPISFVKEVLFPYAREKISNYVLKNLEVESVQDALYITKQSFSELTEDIASQLGFSSINNPRPKDLIRLLEYYIDEDVKHPGLKSLQGLIWRSGYEDKDFTSIIYDEVPGALQQWKSQGLRLAIYSSGSIEAQKLFFTFSNYGNVLDFFETQFDLSTGSKKDKNSYLKIAENMSLKVEQILFLSDSKAELVAASKAGLQSLQLRRPETLVDHYENFVTDFTEIKVR